MWFKWRISEFTEQPCVFLSQTTHRRLVSTRAGLPGRHAAAPPVRRAAGWGRGCWRPSWTSACRVHILKTSSPAWGRDAALRVKTHTYTCTHRWQYISCLKGMRVIHLLPLEKMSAGTFFSETLHCTGCKWSSALVLRRGSFLEPYRYN